MLPFPNDFPTDEAKVLVAHLRSGATADDLHELLRCGWVMEGYAFDQMFAHGEPDADKMGAHIAMSRSECADFLEAQCDCCENPAKAGKAGAPTAPGAFDWMAVVQILLPLLQQLFQRNKQSAAGAPQQGGPNPNAPAPQP